MNRKRVLVASPYFSECNHCVALNIQYARACMEDSLSRGEAPFLSHLLYTQIMDDTIPALRELGLASEHSWLEVAQAVVVYHDRGVSKGMQLAIDKATQLGMVIIHRMLPLELAETYGVEETILHA